MGRPKGSRNGAVGLRDDFKPEGAKVLNSVPIGSNQPYIPVGAPENDPHGTVPQQPEHLQVPFSDYEGDLSELKGNALRGDNVADRQFNLLVKKAENDILGGEKYNPNLRPETLEELKNLYEWLDSRKSLPEEKLYVLYEIEKMALKNECQVVNNPPRAWKAKVGDVYKFKKAYSKERQQMVFSVYVDRVIKGEDRISEKVAKKLSMGLVVGENDIPEDAIQVFRADMVEKEFYKYCKIVG